MHNVTADQIEKNKQLIRLVKNYPQIYNHDPTQHNTESVEEVWSKIGLELEEARKYEAPAHVSRIHKNLYVCFDYFSGCLQEEMAFIAFLINPLHQSV